MSKIVWAVVALSLIAIVVGYTYITVSDGPIMPLGRLAFVKILNPDMYPGNVHPELLAQYAQERGSPCAVVLHFAGSSNYRSFEQPMNTTSSNGVNGVYIIEVAYIDTQGGGSKSLLQTNFLDSFKVALFGVPDDRYKYMSDGVVYNNYTSMMNHVETLAKEHGQTGPLPVVWHGTVRSDSPLIDPGCGFPLYFQIMTKTYGIIPAYVLMVYGLIFPYINSPYWTYEVSHATELQNLYNAGELNSHKASGESAVDQYYQNLTKVGTTNYD